MVIVPNVAPDTPALQKNPVFMYLQDRFQKPNPFTPDVAVSLDDVIEKKLDMLDAHVSQMYEWLPWVDGVLASVPKGVAERRKWLKETVAIQPNPAVRAALVKWYGPEKGKAVQYAEALGSSGPARARTRPWFESCFRSWGSRARPRRAS